MLYVIQGIKALKFTQVDLILKANHVKKMKKNKKSKNNRIKPKVVIKNRKRKIKLLSMRILNKMQMKEVV